MIKMTLVPQCLSEKFIFGVIRKRKQNSTIACRLFWNFNSIILLLNFQVFREKAKKIFPKYFSYYDTKKEKFKKRLHGNVEKTFLYRLTSFRAPYVKNCGTRVIFGNTYVFCTKIFVSFFPRILIGWNFDSFQVRLVLTHKKKLSSIGS
jgi:hypothetical protein